MAPTKRSGNDDAKRAVVAASRRHQKRLDVDFKKYEHDLLANDRLRRLDMRQLDRLLHQSITTREHYAGFHKRLEDEIRQEIDRQREPEPETSLASWLDDYPEFSDNND